MHNKIKSKLSIWRELVKSQSTANSCNQPIHCTSFCKQCHGKREICQHLNTQQHVLALRALAEFLLSSVHSLWNRWYQNQDWKAKEICFKRIFVTTQLSNSTGTTMACWGKLETLSWPKQSQNSLSEKLSTATMFALQTCRQLPSPWNHQKPHSSCAPAMQKPVKGPRMVQFRAVSYQNWFMCFVIIKFTWTNEKGAS